MDYRLLALLLIAALLVLALLQPTLERERPSYAYMAVVDITGSMNVTDYRAEGLPITRLEIVRRSLRQALRDMPCGSRLGLALFTERQTAVLFMPIEVCGNFAALDQAIERIDWRAAWLGDSNIIQGFRHLLGIFRGYGEREGLDFHLLFMTDGHEAPPVNPRYLPDLRRFRDQGGVTPSGLVIGVGGDTPAPIPKFDESGQQIGFWEAGDVPHRSTFGLPEDPGGVEGYHPRNAPWGHGGETGTEHLSSLHEEYLQRIASDAGFAYHRLRSAADFSRRLQRGDFAETQSVPVTVDFIPAGLALLALAGLYLVPRRRLRAEPPRRQPPSQPTRETP